MKTLLQIIIMTFLLSMAFVSSADAQNEKTIYIFPETAKIYYNGHEVGNGSYTIKFRSKDDFVILKFEAPGYLSKTVKLFKKDPKKTISYELALDEASASSFGSGDGVDIANKFFEIEAGKEHSDDYVWKKLMNIAITNFENVEIKDKSAGWIRTAWVNTTFLYQVVRTRLEIQTTTSAEGGNVYRVKVSSEIADKDCGIGDQCFEKYNRVLKKYVDIISEIQNSLK